MMTVSEFLFFASREYSEVLQFISLWFLITSIYFSMKQTQDLEEKSKLENEKAIKYMRTACIKLEWLHFQKKKLNFKHIQKLKSCLQKDCWRLDIHNHVLVIIDQQHLDAALWLFEVSKIELSKSSSYEFFELSFWDDYRLICLHERQRIEAAKLTLSSSSNKW